MTKKLLLAGLIALLSVGVAVAKPCCNDNAVWSSQWDTDEGEPYWILYFPNGCDINHADIRLEKWQDNEKLGTLSGIYECSNGFVICGIRYPVNRKKYEREIGGAEEINAVIEIDEGRDRNVEWMILTHINRTAYDNDGVKMEWEPGHAPDKEADPEMPPEVYKNIGCQRP